MTWNVSGVIIATADSNATTSPIFFSEKGVKSMPVKERHFCHLLNTRVDRLLLFSLIASILTCTAARAQSDPPPPPTAPNSYHDSFEQGYLFFDDGVGVLHVRQSGSTAEGDYAHGISGSDGGFYGRLLVQPWLQNNAGPGLASSM
jgi:hypothetical protein